MMKSQNRLCDQTHENTSNFNAKALAYALFVKNLR